MATFIIRYLRNLFDVNTAGAVPGDVLELSGDGVTWVPGAGGGGGGAPTTATYLVGAADATLTNEIVVGATPGGELGNTWASPTVDAVHSGSSHAATQAAAEATAAAALSAHVTDPTDAHDGSAISNIPAGTIASTDVQAALNELDGQIATSLSDAVILAPASSARNVIQPTAGTVIAAIVKAHAAQSVDLVRWVTSADVALASIGPTGTVTLMPSDLTANALVINPAGTPRSDLGGYEIVIGAPGAELRMGLEDLSPGTNPFIQLGDVSTSATSVLIEPGYFNMGNVLQSDATGRLLIQPTGTLGLVLEGPYAAAADGSIGNGQLSFWYDRTNGAAKLMLKGKTTDGTVVTWTIPNGVVYVAGGTDVALADGGTGASLVDPGADRMMFWDDSAGVVTWLTPGTNLAITGTTLDATGGGGAPTTATYITQTPDAGLSAEQALSALATGLVKNTTGTGVLSIGAQGTDYYAPGGTDVAVADGGTGASTAAGARTALDVPSNAEAILDAIVDAKGDLLSATAADTPARLAVGTNGQVLTADSAQATGIKWAAAAAGSSAITPLVRTGQTWYYTVSGSNFTAATFLNGVLYAMPIWLPACTVDRVTIDVGSVGSAGSLARLGLYADSGFGYPGALLADGGTVDTNTSGGTKQVTVSVVISTPGLYWRVYAQQGAPTPNLCQIRTLQGQWPIAFTTFTGISNAQQVTAYTVSGVTGALPDPFGTAPLTVIGATGTPSIAVRVT